MELQLDLDWDKYLNNYPDIKKNLKFNYKNGAKKHYFK